MVDRLVRTFGIGISTKQVHNITTIDPAVIRDLAAAELCEGGKQIHDGGGFRTFLPCRHHAGPTDDGGYTHSAFPSHHLGSSQGPGGSIMRIVSTLPFKLLLDPWTVVRGKDH